MFSSKASTVSMLILAAFISGCAHSDPWTQQDTNRQWATTAIIIGDGLSSIKIRETANVYEAGAIASRVMGQQPTETDLILYHGAVSFISWRVARALPASLRPYWQTLEMFLHGSAIVNNCELGLC